MYKKVCADCGGDFESKAKNTVYCPSCIKKRQSQFAKERGLCKIGGRSNADKHAAKKTSGRAKEVKQSICDSFCRGCIYLLGGNDRLMTCDYLEKTDKRRPCPAGKGCTVKTSKRQRKDGTYAHASTQEERI